MDKAQFDQMRLTEEPVIVELDTYAFDADSATENSFRCTASVMGVLMRNGAVILPDAISKKVCKASVSKGWLDVNHDWDAREIIGMFDAVQIIDTVKLDILSSFHSTDDAQKQRTIIQERLAKGKEVPVSIGYNVNWAKVVYFESGKDLLAWCEEQGYDMSLFDTKSIGTCSWCWVIPEITELWEVSVCCVGKNPGAMGTECNNFGESKTLADALDSALAALKRAQQVRLMRQSAGRDLNDDRMGVIGQIRDLANAIIEPAPATEDGEDSEAEVETTDEAEQNELTWQFLQLEARSRGILD